MRLVFLFIGVLFFFDSSSLSQEQVDSVAVEISDEIDTYSFSEAEHRKSIDSLIELLKKKGIKRGESICLNTIFF